MTSLLAWRHRKGPGKAPKALTVCSSTQASLPRGLGMVARGVWGLPQSANGQRLARLFGVFCPLLTKGTQPGQEGPRAMKPEKHLAPQNLLLPNSAVDEPNKICPSPVPWLSSELGTRLITARSVRLWTQGSRLCHG